MSARAAKSGGECGLAAVPWWPSVLTHMACMVALALFGLLVSPTAGYGAGHVTSSREKGEDGHAIIVLRYTGETADEANRLSVWLDGSDYLFRDDGATLTTGGSCSQESEHVARCDSGFGYYTVSLLMDPGDDRAQVGPLLDPLVAWGDNGDDFIASENPTAGRDAFTLPYDQIEGGPGDDTLLGGPGADRMRGGGFGHDPCFEGGPACGGRDTIDGRGGDDVVQDSDQSGYIPVDRDTLSGGPGRDTLDYSFRRVGSVHVSLDPATAQWADNEDEISGFEDLTGTAHSDGLTGDGTDNELAGGDGADSLFGRAGNDTGSGGPERDLVVGGQSADSLLGESGDDRIRGGAGRDALDGGRGRDRLGGGAGDDDLQGRSGSDILNGRAGRDGLDAGTGDDLIISADGTPERIDCGDGYDSVSADPSDRLIGCERIRR